jgi:hypothetical protein
MAKPVFDISILGDKALEARLAAMHPRLQRKVGRAALRKSAQRTRQPLVQAVSGSELGIVTGQLLTVMASAMSRKPLPGKRSRLSISFLVPMPTREDLGLSPKEALWPKVLEYGSVKSGFPPHPWIRNTINRMLPREQKQIGRDIGKGIEREWKKGAKFVATGKK